MVQLFLALAVMAGSEPAPPLQLGCTPFTIELITADDDKPAELMAPQEEFLRNCTGEGLSLATEPELVVVQAHSSRTLTFYVKDQNGVHTTGTVTIVRE